MHEIKRLPGEKYSDYFRRAMKIVAEEQKTYLILINFNYVDVTVETSFDYLKGYYEALLGALD